MPEENVIPEHSPEIKDILEMIRRYSVVNKNCAFIFQFVTYEPDVENSCNECGENCERVSQEKSICGAFGYLDELRMMLNVARNEIEDNIDEEGYVNL